MTRYTSQNSSKVRCGEKALSKPITCGGGGNGREKNQCQKINSWSSAFISSNKLPISQSSPIKERLSTTTPHITEQINRWTSIWNFTHRFIDWLIKFNMRFQRNIVEYINARNRARFQRFSGLCREKGIVCMQRPPKKKLNTSLVMFKAQNDFLKFHLRFFHSLLHYFSSFNYKMVPRTRYVFIFKGGFIFQRDVFKSTLMVFALNSALNSLFHKAVLKTAEIPNNFSPDESLSRQHTEFHRLIDWLKAFLCVSLNQPEILPKKKS